MGCFSFICSECGEPINSNSFSGEHCILFLLNDGKIQEWMQGEYDSYGRVFKESTGKDQKESQQWETTTWDGVCDLMFDENPDSGIGAYHTECWANALDQVMPVVADRDPDQGWGEYHHTTKGKFFHGIGEEGLSFIKQCLQ